MFAGFKGLATLKEMNPILAEAEGRSYMNVIAEILYHEEDF